MIKKVVYLSLLTLTLSSCGGSKKLPIAIPKLSLVTPFYVNSEELASLSTGMTKDEALSVLGNLSPYDILVAHQDGCELHQYKYKKPAKELFFTKENKSEGLRSGERKYLDESDAFLLYKNGTLESVLTNMGKKDALNVLVNFNESQSTCSAAATAAQIYGCMDPLSVNYNPNAILDDGKCEYPPCGYEINKSFNPKRPISDCNQRYVKINIAEIQIVEDVQECTNCDIIEKLSKSNATINVTIDAKGSNKPSITPRKVKADPAPDSKSATPAEKKPLIKSFKLKN